MMTFICVVSIALSLVQIPALALLFRRAHRLSRGQGWCYRDLQRVLLRIGAVESSLTDAREEQEKLRDRRSPSMWLPPSWTCSPQRKRRWPPSPRGWRTFWATPLRPDGRKHETGDGKAGVGPVLPGGGL